MRIAAALPHVALLALLPLALTAVPTLASAQVIEGAIIDVQDERPLSGVRVELLGDVDRRVTAISDRNGRFKIEAPGEGMWQIRAELLGYAPAASDTFHLADTEFVTVRIRMAVAALDLDERLVVVGVRRFEDPQMAGFHRRRLDGERSGFGHFLYGEELERRPGRVTDVVRSLPGITSSTDSEPMAGNGAAIEMRHCFPDVYVDGLQINTVYPFESVDQYVDRGNLAGIEVYNGGQQPMMYRDPSGCGVVLIWTRNDASGEPFTWPRFLIGIGLVVGLVVLGNT